MHLLRSLVLSSFVFTPAALAQNLPPVVHTGGNAGVNYLVDCNNVFSLGGAVTSVQLDGSGSFDPNGTPVTFFWHNECPAGSFDDPNSPTPVYHVDMTGTCFQECWIALRVSSGGQTSIQGFRVIVEDVTPPVITGPADVLGVFGDAIDPLATGHAGASDNCDPAPVISFHDVTIPATGPGQPELNLVRTWTVTDCTGRASQVLQAIVLLAPTGAIGARANLDFDPTQCPNQYSALDTGTVDAILLGSAKFKAEHIIKPTVRIWLRGNPSASVAPIAFQLKDVGSITATSFGECNSPVLDGMRDLRLRFNRTELANVLGLGSLTPGQTVEVAVFGFLVTGKKWAVRDTITIQ